MKATTTNPLSNSDLTQSSPTSKLGKIGLTLTLTTTMLCGLAVSSSAQNSAVTKSAAEQAFTIAPNIQTPIVLKTQPDAACDLHAEGVSDPAHTLRLYANGDGYVKVHVKAKQESDEGGRVQLDCTEGNGVTRYPLHLRAASSPTKDMPAPQTVMPTPKGSQVLPALPEEQAQQLSDSDLASLGYPARPDPAASPDRYAKWLDMVSQPITILPSHQVSRSDISHHPGGVQAGTSNINSYNWSGFMAQGSERSYMEVSAMWSVPEIVGALSDNVTYSAFWVGLDGFSFRNLSVPDLVQAGTEQDYVDIFIFSYANYSAWTELLPNQPTEQDTSLSPNPGDTFLVNVWIGNSGATQDQNGGYGWFFLWDQTQGQAVRVATPLSGTHFNGYEAEWIMERPGLGGGSLAELSDYGLAYMYDAYALTTKSKWVASGTAANWDIALYNQGINGPDNNLLSLAEPALTDSMWFFWFNFN